MEISSLFIYGSERTESCSIKGRQQCVSGPSQRQYKKGKKDFLVIEGAPL